MVKKATKLSIVILASLILLCAILVGGIGINYGMDFALSDGDIEILHAFAAEDPADGNVMYLSDIGYDLSKSTSLGGGATRLFLSPQQKDKIPGKAIQVKIENGWYTFENGIYAHGPSYVAFNVEQYTTNGYKWFTAYGGLLPSAEKSDGAYFHVSYSSDGKNWTPYIVEPDDKAVAQSQDQDRLKNGQILIKYNQNAQYYQIDVEGVKWLRIGANMNKSNAQDYVVFADAKLSKTLNAGEDVKSVAAFDAEIKAKAGSKAEKVNLSDKSLERLILQRELVSRVGQYALKRFKGESEDNKAMLNWLLNDLDALREFMMGGAPMAGSYYESLKVLADLYKSYKDDLNEKALLENKFMPNRTYGELYRTMMFSVALTHDHTIGSYLQASRKENQSEPLRRYAIFKYLYKTNRFVATSSYETMSLFGSLRVEEMRFIMSNIIDDESIIWLNEYVQTRINAAPKNASGLHTPHSYVRYTDPNYNNPVFYANENYDYFNELFAVDGRDDNLGNKLANGRIGLWDSEYKVPGPKDPVTGEISYYTMKVSRSAEGEAKLQKVWMNFNNKFKTGSVCGGISKSGTNIRTSRGIPAHVIGQPGHAAILYYKKDANGNGSWAIDNDVGGWLAATKGERHLLGWGNASWQRNSGGTVVYFHLSQACLNDYDNLVKAEEYCWLAKVYAGDLETQEKLYGGALAVQPMNLDAWYGLTTTFMANPAKTVTNFCSLVDRIADTFWNHPVAMHCLFRVLNVAENPNPEATKAQRSDSVFISQMRTVEVNALAKAKASGSSAAKSKVNYFLGNTDMSVADFSFDGENAGCIVWSDTYKGSGFRWRYSLDGKNTWSDEIIFTGDEEAPIYKLPDNQINAVSTDNDIYVYIVGADPNNAYKIDVAAKPSLPDTVYANDWENRFIGVNGNYEWRYCSSSTKETGMGLETVYKSVSNWRSFAEATPDCTGNVAVEVRIKGTSKNPASDSKIFTFTKDVDDETKKYISIDYLTLVGFSTQSQDAKRPNYAVNAIDGNANTYWHTDYAKDLKTPVSIDGGNATFERAYLVVKLDVPRWVSNLEFSQRQYNSAFSIFAKTVKVYVSQDGKTWGNPAATRTDLENMENLNVVNFEKPVYGQYIKIEMAELWETNTKDGTFTTVSLINIYEDTTKKTAPDGKDMPSLSTVTPGNDSTAGFGAVVRYENAAGEKIVNDEEFEGIHSSDTYSAVLGTTLAAVLADYSDNYADDTFDDIFVDISGNNSGDNAGDNSNDNSGDNAGDNAGDNSNDNSGNNAGLIVGVVVGVIAVLAIGGAVGAFFFMKHRKAKGQSNKTAKAKKEKKAEAPKEKKPETAKAKKDEPVKAQKSEPAKAQKSEPAKAQKSEPAKAQKSEPAKAQKSEPAKAQKSEPAKAQKSEPAKDQKSETTKGKKK